MSPREFRQIFDRLYMPLSMFALRLCGDTDDADDIVQEAFLRVWEMLEAGAEIRDIRAYLYRSVRNGALTRMSGGHSLGLEAMADVPDEEIDTSERDARLWEAIDRLPERCRQVFLLSKRDGLSNAEIADELGISVKTVENQMTKAFRQLRETLRPDNGRVFFLPFL